MNPITKKENGLPIISYSEVDDLAELYAHQFFPEVFVKPQPVDICGFIVMGLGYSVDYQYLSCDEQFLGLTAFQNIRLAVFDRKKFRAEFAYIPGKTVIIDQWMADKAEFDGHEGRLRFTEAHEAGHIVLHSDFFSSNAEQTQVGLDNFVEGSCQSVFYSGEKMAETQADWFASCILMPHSAVESLMISHYSRYWTDKEKCELVKETFNVSWPSAFYRLQRMGYLDSVNQKFDWEQLCSE